MNQIEASDYNRALEKIKILTEALNDIIAYGGTPDAETAEEALRKAEEMK